MKRFLQVAGLLLILVFDKIWRLIRGQGKDR